MGIGIWPNMGRSLLQAANQNQTANQCTGQGATCSTQMKHLNNWSSRGSWTKIQTHLPSPWQPRTFLRVAVADLAALQHARGVERSECSIDVCNGNWFNSRLSLRQYVLVSTSRQNIKISTD